MKTTDSREPRHGSDSLGPFEASDVPEDPHGNLQNLRENELAQRWRISLRTLQRWRSKGRAPAHLLIGHRVLYRRVDVEAFERRHLRAGEGADR